jgi:hypothetical protein
MRCRMRPEAIRCLSWLASVTAVFKVHLSPALVTPFCKDASLSPQKHLHGLAEGAVVSDAYKID